MQSAFHPGSGAVMHWKPQPPAVTASSKSSNANSPEALLSNLSFLQRMADAFEEQGNYAECVRSAESALLLRQANAAAVVAALTARQQRIRKNVNAAAAPTASSRGTRTPAAAPPPASSNDGMVALTDKGDVQLPLEISWQAQDVVRRCNSYAVEALRHGKFDSAAFFLNRAMFLTDGDGDDISDLRGGLQNGETWGPTSGTSDKWWWRRMLQPPQQRQTTSTRGMPASEGGNEVKDVLDISNDDASNGTPSETAAALRACFRNTPHDQQLRLTLRVSTLNHLGCLEQRRGRLDAAITFLRMAIRLATQVEAQAVDGAYSDAAIAVSKANIASTYLNLCTVLNAVGRYAEAVHACERVVPLLHQALQETVATAPSIAANASTSQKQKADDRVPEQTPVPDSEEARVATMLVVAYYNLGVSLERQNAAGRGGKHRDQNGPQLAFQQAVQISRAYHLVPASCRSIEAAMRALHQPQQHARDTNNEAADELSKERQSIDEGRPRREEAEEAVARDEVTAAATAQPRPPSRGLSDHTPTHSLPRIAAALPSHPRGTVSSLGSISNTLTPFARNKAEVPISAVRRPSIGTRVSGSSTQSGSANSTYPTPTAQDPPQQPAPLFPTSKAWRSPFATSPLAHPPPAFLAPLVPGGGVTPAPAASSALPPAPHTPLSAITQRSAAGLNFAATAPPAPNRPPPSAPPPSDLSGSGNGRGAAERATTAATTMNASGSSIPAARSSSTQFGRHPFGSSMLPLPVLRGSSARSQGVDGRTTTTRPPMSLSIGNASGTSTATHKPRNRLAAAVSANAMANSGEIGRSKQQRSKRQKSIDRLQQREAAAIDAVLAEKMYQQLVSEKEKTEVERCRSAAVQIQRVWRGVLARTWVMTLIRASVCLQRAVRHFLMKARAEHARVAAEQVRIRAEESARQEAACRILQVRVRQFLRRLQIRREYRANQARLFYAARRIQRGYRAFCAQRAAKLAELAVAHRREDEQRLFREKVATRRIMHAYLHYKAKRAELEANQVQQRRIRSVVRIQAVVRGYLTRAWYAYYRVYRREQEVRSAAMQAKLTVIQSACRAICSAYYGQRRALQALLHMREAQRHSAATKIQCMWRCHVAVIHRERLQAEHDRDVRRATRIQRWYRMRAQRRTFLAWRAEQQRMRAAVRLQRWVRGCWQAAKAREFAAYHAELLRQQQLKRLQARAITAMQACAQACLSSRLVASVRNTFERNDAMARRWQRVGRGFEARREMALERYAAHQVALKEKEMARCTAAVQVLQRAWRCAAAKDKVETMRRELAAANVIAHAYRVYCARVQLAELREARQLQRENAAARRIQQAARGFLYGRRARAMDVYYREEHKKKMLRLRRIEAAVMIQAQWRGYVTRKAMQEERSIMQALSAAATVIQRAWKSSLARQQLHRLLAERIIERNHGSRAALTLQCFWRKMLAAHRVAKLRLEMRRRLAAVNVLQSWWRMQMAQREFARLRRQRREEAALEVYYAIQWEKHATLINAFLRQHDSQVVVLNQLRQKLVSQLTEENRRRFLSRHGAATKIQALFRGHYERYYVRGLLAQAREEQRRAAELFARQQRAATMIQCAYRSAQARRKLAELKNAEFDRVQASHADYLESVDTSEVVRELFWLYSTYQQREAALRRKEEAAERHDAAARIQRLYRRHRARHVVAAALDRHQQERAARLLQDYWRHHRDVRRIKEHQRRQAAATLLQSHIRGWIVRRSWPIYRSTIEAERQERVLVQDVLDHAAIVLQCFWRRVEAQRTTARRRLLRQMEHDARAQQEAATVIQEAFRSYRWRKKTGML
ncbi:hypothetical protein ABL78_7060 [Leptomonas seymouri]|uniref:Uncharacterized protein n=1 Tax=Leptomonas seymouri TaxID=5684 RepID=A0A0N1IIB0_LEPSE|nr:hypothetical protein ABL78_7060 [Leptomonas seymouri]|eukprot:KPI83900.1 hypothetical protein ABL78_7060 [Leptomonas seymouri]